jgi:rhamnogalacturonan endolyase
MKTRLAIVIALAAFSVQASAACTSWGKPGQLLYADEFGGKLDRWVPEYRAAPGSSIGIQGGQLAIDVAGDATLWFKPKLTGNVLISYDRTVVMDGGPNDRLSDLNQFWMATDPSNANLFTRDGTFKQYDALLMYYAGIGGNTNTTTRLRKYAGGERVLLADLGDSQHLLAPNRRYAVQVAVFEGCTRVLVDGKEYFSYFDPSPLREGWFGFRTTHSRQLIDNFTVHRLDTER